jgi:hypothetical protein
MTTRIAMWSGPRNISTAMMRAFENRADCAVVDEPFYAHYLSETGLDHPGRDDVIAHGETDASRVIAALLGPVPDGRAVFYQKHMTHHMLPPISRAWLADVTNVFLIRDPREVLVSYIKSRPRVCAEDLGVPQEAALYEHARRLRGDDPVVIDTGEFLRNPRAHLAVLCERVGIPFDERMLQWPAGPRASDGIWAPHWYDAVWRSTGFEPWRAREDLRVPPEHAAVIDELMPHYEALRERRLRP